MWRIRLDLVYLVGDENVSIQSLVMWRDDFEREKKDDYFNYDDYFWNCSML